MTARCNPFSFTLLCLAALVAPMPLGALELPSPERSEEIIDHVDRVLRGDSSRAEVELAVVTRRWERNMELAIVSEGTDKALVRVLAPRREEGAATLKVGTDIWNYLPRADRTVRVPSSMMMASWMGSHFTNDDLVQHSRMIRDYEIEATFAGERNGVELYEFSLTPREDAAVVWGGIELEVRAEDLVPLESRYFGEDGELRRTMEFSDFREIGDRMVPTRMRLHPEDKPDEYTEMNYRSLEFDVEIAPGTFSLDALR